MFILACWVLVNIIIHFQHASDDTEVGYAQRVKLNSMPTAYGLRMKRLGRQATSLVATHEQVCVFSRVYGGGRGN